MTNGIFANLRDRVGRWCELYLSPRERTGVLAGGYISVIVFFAALAVVRSLWTDIPWASALLLAGIFVSPLPLALFWGQIKSVELAGLTMTLRDLSVYVQQDIAAKIQGQRGSNDQVIVEGLVNALAVSEPELLEVNLRDGHYWWPTRIFLVAAIADDYTSIRRILFVHHGSERRFIGLATPTAVRQAFATHPEFLRFDYEAKYARAQGGRKLPFNGGSPTVSILQICYSWGEMFKTAEEGARDVAKEEGSAETWERKNFDQPVDKDLLIRCLGKRLDESFICWDEWDEKVPRLLQYQILNCEAPYTALVQDGRLVEVAAKRQLAMRIAKNVV